MSTPFNEHIFQSLICVRSMAQYPNGFTSRLFSPQRDIRLQAAQELREIHIFDRYVRFLNEKKHQGILLTLQTETMMPNTRDNFQVLWLLVCLSVLDIETSYNNSTEPLQLLEPISRPVPLENIASVHDDV